MPRRKRKRSTREGDEPGLGKDESKGHRSGPVGTNLGQLLKRAASAQDRGRSEKAQRNPGSKPPCGGSIPATKRPPGPEPPVPVSDPEAATDPAEPTPQSATELRWLNDAYEGVTPLHRTARARIPRTGSRLANTESALGPGVEGGRFEAASVEREEEAAHQRLDALVGEDVHFIVDEQEDGWVAARRQDVGRQALRRLRAKGFHAEASLDLHGCPRTQVARLVTSFVRNQHRAGCRYALIVHGKGLHSPDRHGVLGEAVFETLTRGGAAPLVRAVSTPDARHGGRGATAVELG